MLAFLIHWCFTLLELPRKKTDYCTVVGGFVFKFRLLLTTPPLPAHIHITPCLVWLDSMGRQRLWNHLWLRFSFLWWQHYAVCLSGELLQIGCWHLVAGLNMTCMLASVWWGVGLTILTLFITNPWCHTSFHDARLACLARILVRAILSIANFIKPELIKIQWNYVPFSTWLMLIKAKYKFIRRKS